MSPVILAIESSCDETAAAIINNGKVDANIVASQAVHENYGGVVPELASRAHQQNIVPVVEKALNQAKIAKKDLNAVAFTQGPGLLGSLLVGASFAKAMARALDIPLIGVHHMKAHIHAHFIDEPRPGFPFLCLTVSGGHTQIVKITDYLDMEVIGNTQDDAAGEAFDKCAKILGFSYPGGAMIDKFAQEGDPYRFEFPSTSVPVLNFSFSGIKTAFLYFLRDEQRKDNKFIEKNLPDLCASIQHTLIEMLMEKLLRAVEETGINEVAIAGGVSANSRLRKRISEIAKIKGWNIYIPAFEYCTDNAAMIAMTAHFKFKKKLFASMSATPEARLRFDES